MINYIKKDITTVDTGVIAHGVNCQRVMGSGVAKAIKEKWPIVYEKYMNMPMGKGMLGVGHLIPIEHDRLCIVNCYTQVFYGYGGRFADPKAIEDSLWDAYAAADYYHLPLYMPKIGAGLGGLDWKKEVEPIVEYAISKWSRVDTYVCEWGN